MGTAHDILAAGNPPRSVFLDFPLGNTVGRPFAAEEQHATTRAALEALEGIREPGQIIALDHTWSDDEAWKVSAMKDDRGDQRQPRDLTPRYQFEDDRIAAEG
ncbi:MAG: hypothetical protein CMO26_19685 [Thiotrichales bacterium]|nr:hypothetical protein [Thiotrichales bacterium]